MKTVPIARTIPFAQRLNRIKKTLQLALWFIPAFVLGGCASLYPIQVEVLEPAKVTIAPAYDSLLIINRTKTVRHDKSSHYVKNKEGSKIHVRKLVGHSAVKRLQGSIKNSPKYRYTEIIYDTAYNKATALNARYLKQLHQNFSVDAAIILDSLTYNYFASLKRQNRSGYIQASTEVIFGATWKYADLKNGKLLDTYNMGDKKKWEDYFYDKEQALSALPDKKKTATRTGQKLGTIYAKRIAPQWHKAQRYIFAHHPKMQEAENAALNANWQRAAALWKPLAESDNNIIAEYAAFNMAVASEILGKPDIALYWAEKAYEKFNNKTISKYINTLKDVKKKQQVLNEQLP